ncbi:methyltransferase domain-containing protein [Streptomyces sp. A 4/2]|uniref:methyltransferase domain-containing protein n=1 Tax=Streptomyces sp. A 4/2 TaxID=2934314 RepID=UPI002024F2FB|nr:methyltransferase domain-containing protein [Streptomyces sp. A 4/2]
MNQSAADIARPHLAVLSDELAKAGVIRTPQWAEAFSKVPRHVLVPRWYEQETNARGITVWRLRHTVHEGGLEDVYRDRTLVTALDPASAEKVDDQAWTGIPTSSSTLPSLMAGMLDDLSVQDGQRVLEIGTGTGYNAGLLSARLADHLVHSVDVDPDFVQLARTRLGQLGFHPHLAVGDGQSGFPGGGRFDRIIATCSVPRIPDAWIEQTEPGGFVLTDLACGIDGGIVRLAVEADGTATGHYTRTSGRFMPARSAPTTYPNRQRAPYATETGTRPTVVTATDIRGCYPFRLLLGFTLPDAELVYHIDDDGRTALQLQTPDGAWARTPLTAPHGGATVTWGGPGELWEEVEAAWRWWTEQGMPDQSRYGITRAPDGHVHAWYAPDGRRWNLGA